MQVRELASRKDAFYFHQDFVQDGIVIERDGRTVSKGHSTHEFSFAVFNAVPLHTGLHRFELTVERCSRSTCGAVGVVHSDFVERSWPRRPSTKPFFWSFACYARPRPEQIIMEDFSDRGPYGTRAGPGDKITAHVNMDGRTMGFSVNDVYYGEAFRSLPDRVYFAIAMYYPQTTVFVLENYLVPGLPRLQTLCSVVIQKSLRMESNAEELPLPKKLQQFISSDRYWELY
ncbi:uncharacterized protein LOC134192353 [Corticium candelabrum]|uniref:uncharacterized protein LOC134192353 n=1 Tax=Corticium candelabrum TaxID=121492 RepID=UPI002E26812C|nr:uncharacterized protein LOC134192353 [Corticium candelabrum]